MGIAEYLKLNFILTYLFPFRKPQQIIQSGNSLISFILVYLHCTGRMRQIKGMIWV